MAVYGAEHHPIDISQGLYLSPTPDNIPDGFCQELVNMFRTDRGTWEMRKGFTYESPSIFLDSNTSISNNQVADTRIPETQGIFRFGELYGGESSSVGASPQFWISYQDSFGVGALLHNTGKRASTDTVNTNTQGPTVAVVLNKIIADMCQFKDRFYAAIYQSNTSIKVVKISNWAYDGTTPAATSVLVATLTTEFRSPSFIDYCLFVYQNRMWATRGRRLIYTDLPTPGGYPETWNTGSNFIDLPESSVGTPLIVTCIPLNGLLYIFTDKGVFVLNARSSNPLSWTLNFVTNKGAIVSRNSVRLVGGLFIITDRFNLFMFDGSNFKTIGDPIKYVFNIYNSFSICPFLDGFVLSCRYLSAVAGSWTYAVPPGGNSTVWPISRCFYFDGSVWSELSIGGSVGSSGSLDPIYGNTNKQVSNGLQENISYLLCHADISGTPYHVLLYYDVSRKDDLLASATSIPVSLRTKDVISSAFVNRQRLAKGKIAISKVKEGYIRCFSLLATITTQMFKNGSSVAVTDTATGNAFKTTTLTDLADNNYEVKVPGAEFNSRVSVRIVPTTGVAPTTFSSDLPTSVPIFEIKDVVLVVNTDYRDEPDTITT